MSYLVSLFHCYASEAACKHVLIGHLIEGLAEVYHHCITVVFQHVGDELIELCFTEKLALETMLLIIELFGFI